MSNTHDLKTWPAPFSAVLRGAKTYEIRADDRGYAVGDRLLLREWAVQPLPTLPAIGTYTGRSLLVEVTYITRGGEWGLPAGMCVMAIRKVESSEWATTWEVSR